MNAIDQKEGQEENPCRQKSYLVDGAQGVFPKRAHWSKPLLGGPENRGFFGAPVVGVFVGIGLLFEQGAAFGQSGDHGGVAFTQDIQPNKPDMPPCHVM